MPREIEGFMHVWDDADGGWSIIVPGAQCPAQTGYCRGCSALDAVRVLACDPDHDALSEGTLQLPVCVLCARREAP